MNTMWHAEFCVFLVPCLMLLTFSADGCDTNGPGNCQFHTVNGEPDWCGWTPGGDFELDSTGQGWHVRLTPGKDAGNLTSRTACSTGGQTHCLRFAYRFDVDGVYKFSVSIKNNSTNEAESLLWRLSFSNGWEEASVPINTSHGFVVIFRAQRYCGQKTSQDTVLIDAIRFDKLSFCMLQPPAASPTTVLETPSSCTSTISSASTTPTMERTSNTPLQSTSDDDIGQNTTSRDAETAHNTEAITQSGRNKGTPAESSNKAGVIASGVLAGVVITGIVALVVLFRQKRLRWAKPCCENKQKERCAQDTDGYEIPEPRQNSENHEEMASTRAENEDTRETDPRRGETNGDRPVQTQSSRLRQVSAPRNITVNGSIVVRQNIENDEEVASTIENEGTRETFPRTDKTVQREHDQAQSRVPLPRATNSYDCLDFTNTELERSIYTSLGDSSDEQGASRQRGLYQALGQRRDSHVYCQAQGSGQDTDTMNSAVYYNVVER